MCCSPATPPGCPLHALRSTAGLPLGGDTDPLPRKRHLWVRGDGDLRQGLSRLGLSHLRALQGQRDESLRMEMHQPVLQLVTAPALPRERAGGTIAPTTSPCLLPAQPHRLGPLPPPRGPGTPCRQGRSRRSLEPAVVGASTTQIPAAGPGCAPSAPRSLGSPQALSLQEGASSLRRQLPAPAPAPCTWRSAPGRSWSVPGSRSSPCRPGLTPRQPSAVSAPAASRSPACPVPGAGAPLISELAPNLPPPPDARPCCHHPTGTKMVSPEALSLLRRPGPVPPTCCPAGPRLPTAPEMIPPPHLGVLLWNVLLGVLGQLQHLGVWLLVVVAVGAVH